MNLTKLLEPRPDRRVRPTGTPTVEMLAPLRTLPGVRQVELKMLPSGAWAAVLSVDEYPISELPTPIRNGGFQGLLIVFRAPAGRPPSPRDAQGADRASGLGPK